MREMWQHILRAVLHEKINLLDFFCARLQLTHQSYLGFEQAVQMYFVYLFRIRLAQCGLEWNAGWRTEVVSLNFTGNVIGAR